MYGAIEAGGTKFVCAVSDDNLQIIERISIPTATPQETMKQVFDFFDQYQLTAMGIGSFGPIDVNKQSKTYGFITTTPKLAWENFDFVGSVKKKYDIPVAWTTDVNAAAFGEWKMGAALGRTGCLYLTVGTGIGGGAVVKGQLLEGLGHPEMGHLSMKRHPEDTFMGNCPYHSDCLEGMASGPAIEKRWGIKASALETDHKAWEIQAYYLAQGLMNFILTISPEKIILGGGVMKQEQLFPLVKKELEKLMNGYVNIPDIVPPALGDSAGITGCLLLAKEM